MHALCDAHPDLCFPMMGPHPCHVAQDFTKDLAEVERLLRARARRYAVGDVDDPYWDKTLPAQQQKPAHRSVGAKEPHYPSASIAARAQRGLQHRGGERGGLAGRWFDCFTGTPELVRMVIDLGVSTGIGGSITYPTERSRTNDEGSGFVTALERMHRTWHLFLTAVSGTSSYAGGAGLGHH